MGMFDAITFATRYPAPSAGPRFARIRAGARGQQSTDRRAAGAMHSAGDGQFEGGYERSANRAPGQPHCS
jgi:hypothetical protein